MPSEPLAPSYFVEKTFRSNNAALLKKIVATEKDPVPLLGMGQVQEAQKLFEAGQFKESRALAEKTKNQYMVRLRSSEVAADRRKIVTACQNLLERIDANSGVQDQMRELEAARRAKSLVQLENKAAKDDRSYLDLYKTLSSIAGQFPDTATGRRCAARVSVLLADEKVVRDIDRERDRRIIAAALQTADLYEKHGLAAKAQAELEKLREKYPHVSLKELRRRAQEQ